MIRHSFEAFYTYSLICSCVGSKFKELLDVIYADFMSLIQGSKLTGDSELTWRPKLMGRASKLTGRGPNVTGGAGLTGGIKSTAGDDTLTKDFKFTGPILTEDGFKFSASSILTGSPKSTV